MNTMSDTMFKGVITVLEMCADDPGVKVLVFTGAGDRAFSAGGDLEGNKASAGMRDAQQDGSAPPSTSAGAVRNLRSAMQTSLMLRDSHFVTIAAVNGACAGAALAWACACDLRVASENAVFKTGFATAGLSGDFGGTWLLPRIVGPARARELYLLDRKVGASEAQQIGLVSKVYPCKGDSFKAEVLAMAAKMASVAPLALKRIKANLVDADRLTFPEHLDIEAERHARSGYHPDAAESGMSFMQRRKPQFKGIGTRQPWEMSRL